MTYGEIRLHLAKALPGVDPELIIDWIQGRYTRILDALSWKRQETESVLQSPARYAIGTVALTQGSNFHFFVRLTAGTLMPRRMYGLLATSSMPASGRWMPS